MAEAAAEAIEAPDDEHVAGAHVIERAVELGPVLERSGGDVLEDTLAALARERVELEVEVLVAGGYPGVAAIPFP